MEFVTIAAFAARAFRLARPLVFAATLFRLFLMIVVTIAISSLPSSTSALRLRLRVRLPTPLTRRASESTTRWHSLRPMQHLEMKSASLSAERRLFEHRRERQAAVQQAAAPSDGRRRRRPTAAGRSRRRDTRIQTTRSRMSWPPSKVGCCSMPIDASREDARHGGDGFPGFRSGRIYPYADSAYAFQIPNSKFLIPKPACASRRRGFCDDGLRRSSSSRRSPRRGSSSAPPSG